jgi:gamma-glutamylcyclotransferase (GGCT)/AIG2-like uncharacterized protein YtfP
MPSRRPRGNIRKPPDHLFVYGTLRRRGRNKYARLLHANSEFLGEATLQARLGRTRPHRGAVLSKNANDSLLGEVFRLNDARRLFPILDEYEGPDYKRTLVPVHLEDGKRIRAWIYLYRP